MRVQSVKISRKKQLQNLHKINKTPNDDEKSCYCRLKVNFMRKINESPEE